MYTQIIGLWVSWVNSKIIFLWVTIDTWTDSHRYFNINRTKQRRYQHHID